jgi:hypothetical protein
MRTLIIVATLVIALAPVPRSEESVIQAREWEGIVAYWHHICEVHTCAFGYDAGRYMTMRNP